MPKYISRRYVKAIKVVLNKIFDSKPSIHKNIAEIIKSFSHKTNVTHGSYLMSKKLNYFVVEKVCSTHFVKGFFCPARLRYNEQLFWYEPDTWFKSRTKIKKLMRPFSKTPHVKERRHCYFLTKLKKHESMHPIHRFAY
jgi:hypothetical protein